MGVLGGCLGDEVLTHRRDHPTVRRPSRHLAVVLSAGHTRQRVPVSNQPTLQDGVVYVDGGSNGSAASDRDHVKPERSENVHALTADTDNEQWRYEAAAGIASAPIARDGAFVVGWNAGTHGIAQRLVRLDDGWSIEAGDTTEAAVHGDTLCAVDGSRRTTAFAVSDGSER
jgi:outer membrane protein assembly factor BamB